MTKEHHCYEIDLTNLTKLYFNTEFGKWLFKVPWVQNQDDLNFDMTYTELRIFHCPFCGKKLER